MKLFILVSVFLFIFSTQNQAQIRTDFTYQGSLKKTGALAVGTYDFEFTLWDQDSDGMQIGSKVPKQLTVTDGIFSTHLDFGSGIFDGSDLYLEISVKDTGGVNFTVLMPRQIIASVPYALNAESVAPDSIGAFEIVPAQVQARVDLGCDVGSTIRSIAEDGSVVCEVDDIGLT